MKLLTSLIIVCLCLLASHSFAGLLPGMPSNYESGALHDLESHYLLLNAYKGMARSAKDVVAFRQNDRAVLGSGDVSISILYPSALPKVGTCGSLSVLSVKNKQGELLLGMAVHWQGDPSAFYEKVGSLYVAVEPYYKGRDGDEAYAWLTPDQRPLPGEILIGRIGSGKGYVSFFSSFVIDPIYQPAQRWVDPAQKRGFKVVGGNLGGLDGEPLVKSVIAGYEKCGGKKQGRLIDYLAYILTDEDHKAENRDVPIWRSKANIFLPGLIAQLRPEVFKGCKNAW